MIGVNLHIHSTVFSLIRRLRSDEAVLRVGPTINEFTTQNANSSNSSVFLCVGNDGFYNVTFLVVSILVTDNVITV